MDLPGDPSVFGSLTAYGGGWCLEEALRRGDPLWRLPALEDLLGGEGDNTSQSGGC